MDRAEYVQRRKAKYMAQTLEAFEAEVEAHLPPGHEAAVKSFKAKVRARFNALATDATEIMSLSDTAEINGLALEMRDRISPVGRP